MKYYQIAGLIFVLVLVCCTRSSVSQSCSGVFTTYVVVDGSASISRDNFVRVKEALKIYISQSINSNTAVKIGVVVYSDNVTEVIQASSNIAMLNNDVDNIVQPEQGTATDLGIDKAKELLLTDPSNNPMVMIVITDGISRQRDLTNTSAIEARDVGIAMIAVGVTGVFNDFPSIKRRFEAELRAIAGSNETVILVQDFSDLVNDMINISRRICGVVVLIQQQLEDRTVLVGSNHVFRTTLSQANIGTGTWTWQGGDLTTDNRYVISTQGNVQTLTIPNVQLSQSGNYTYTIGTIPTTATLTVLDLITDVSVAAGQTAKFRTTVSPSSAGFWSKDGIRLSASSKYVITDNGGNRELRIIGVEGSDQGRYSYTVNGVSTTASLIVEAVIVHGGYTPWSHWIDLTPCLATCGNTALKTARRTRSCTNPPPANGGNDCQLLGPSSEITTVDCGQSVRCAVDGGVGQWGQWSSVACPVTCGFSPDGVRNRSRLCDNPEPSGGGRNCTDSLVHSETRSCNAGQCPTDGGISPWTSWGPAVCDVTCGENIIGVSTRERFCNRPIPSFGGKNCTESRSETIQALCILPSCPVDGVWREWSPWGVTRQCTVTCGGGYQQYTRSRVCIQPQFGGQPCPGSTVDATTRVCNTNACPNSPIQVGLQNRSVSIGDSVTFTVTLLSADITSGIWLKDNVLLSNTNRIQISVVGTQQRLRMSNVQLSDAGSYRYVFSGGATTATLTVDPVDGVWREWSPWVPTRQCNVTCGGGYQPYTRSRVCFQPQFGGQPCQGSATEATTRVCNTNNCPIDGNWAPWSSWSVLKCAVSCDEGQIGVVSRERRCTDPSPQFGGRACGGENSQTSTRLCGLQFCPSKNLIFLLSTSFMSSFSCIIQG